MADYIFLCYSHQNSRFARRLARQLRRQDLRIWLDQWKLSSDERAWDKFIERAVRNCRFFLIILSPAAVNSWVVRDQFELAKQCGKKMVVAIRQPCELPPDLQGLPCFDFTSNNYRAVMAQLLAHLGGGQIVPDNERFQMPVELAQSGLSRLLPLLWPGWLGPVLFLLLLTGASLLFWPEAEDIYSAAPRSERLAVVQASLTPEVPPTPMITRVRVKDGKVMVFVPAGEFMMGSAEEEALADEDEKPDHPVYLDAFWIDRSEVANVQYRLCVAARHCTAQRSQGRRFEGEYQPVVGVDWFQAESYCRWAGGRLPTEAEWEKAGRGTDQRIYPWGEKFDGTRLNFCDQNCMADYKDTAADDGYRYTAPVGSYPEGASPYGALDMSGNVWEWTADWYGANYYAQAPYENPGGPESGQQRVVRGGSWYYYGKNLRVTARHKDLPSYSYDNIGFRCVMED